MKITKSVLISLGLLVLVSALYRVFPGRPPGFAPQIAMAVFSGALFIKNKKWAFALPLISMLASDALYQLLYSAGLSTIQGFYDGQWMNYLLFTGLTAMGFLLKKISIWRIALVSVAAPTVYFLLSNFGVWIGGGGYGRPMTGAGLLLCFQDGLPFYTASIAATILFSGILFGGYFLIRNYWIREVSVNR